MKILLPKDKQCLVTVSPTHSPELADLNASEIIALYKSHGAILFRGFNVGIENFESFTDRFCQSYVRNESPGRDVLSKDGRVQTVNLGHMHFPLHPELSREPWQPDVAWFTCEGVNQLQGETTVCDGIAAAKAFPQDLLSHLQQHQLKHQIPTTLAWCAGFFGKPNLTLEQLFLLSDPNVFEFSMINGELHRSYTRPMLHQPMFSNEWAYGNFLVFARRRLGVSYFPCYPDGSEVADDLVDQIEAVTNSLVQEIKWQKHDLVMLDNTRVMHGRNPIGDPQNRKILTQFGYLTFSQMSDKQREKEIWR